MARSRNIKPGFAKNEFLAQVSFAGRLLFALLPTIADREGRLEDRPLRIKGELFPYEELDVDAILSELATVQGPEQDHPFIVRYQVDGRKFIQVVKFRENQNPHKDEKPSMIPAPCEHHVSTEEAPWNHDATLVQSTKQPRDTGLKVKGIRLKESEKRESGGACIELPPEVATDGLPEAVANWLAYKAERREAYKPTGHQQFVTRVTNVARQRGSPHVVELLQRAMASGWKGWDYENGNQNGKTRQDTGQRPGQRPGSSRRGSLSV